MKHRRPDVSRLSTPRLRGRAALCLVGASLLGLAGCPHRGAVPAGLASGPGRAELDLWRIGGDPSKIFVLAELGDGVPRAFLVDTGASLSVLSREVAAELSLETQPRAGTLVGMGGAVPWKEAELETLRIGPYTFRDLPFAVDVPGAPSELGSVPIAGILGNNIWSQFEVLIDYKANTIELGQVGQLPIPADAGPLYFSGAQPRVPVALLLSAPSGEARRLPLTLEVDTGARGLLLFGEVPSELRPASTVGVELLLGVGSGDDLPLSNFLRSTRRLPLSGLEIGGMKLDQPISSTWVGGQAGARVGPAGLTGLVGHEVLEGKRVLFDFPGGHFVLSESDRTAAEHDLRAWALERLHRPDDEAALLRKVELQHDLGRDTEARETLRAWRQSHPADTRVAMAEARLLRQEGEVDASLQLLLGLPVGVLAEEGEIVAAVNGLWLANRSAEGLDLARRATEQAPAQSASWIAWSDASRVAGDLASARTALKRANQIDENPDGHLIRRAWLSRLEGDPWAVLSHLRRLVELYPNGGVAPWFYAQQVQGTAEERLLMADLSRAVGRLHPAELPFDFLAAAWHTVGEEAKASEMRKAGLERDCVQAKDAPMRDNCEAWYRALSGADLAEAKTRIESALRAEPQRSDFLDTLAVVLEATGDLRGARDAAWRAAARSPDDVYLLWQAGRLDARVRAPQGEPRGG